MCEPVSGDTPVQALHRAIDQLTELERRHPSSAENIDVLMEKRTRIKNIVALAHTADDDYDRQRQELIMKLQGEG